MTHFELASIGILGRIVNKSLQQSAFHCQYLSPFCDMNFNCASFVLYDIPTRRSCNPICLLDHLGNACSVFVQIHRVQTPPG